MALQCFCIQDTDPHIQNSDPDPHILSTDTDPHIQNTDPDPVAKMCVLHYFFQWLILILHKWIRGIKQKIKNDLAKLFPPQKYNLLIFGTVLKFATLCLQKVISARNFVKQLQNLEFREIFGNYIGTFLATLIHGSGWWGRG